MKHRYRDWQRADRFLCGRPRPDQAPLMEFVTVCRQCKAAAEARDRRSGGREAREERCAGAWPGAEPAVERVVRLATHADDLVETGVWHV
jgi:hypothetical protein